MKKRIALLLVSLCLMTACSDRKEDSVLLGDFTVPGEIHQDWTDLFGDNYAITPLETTPDCFIGQIDKIKKYKGDYYIASSGQSILRFNAQGKFVSALNRQGQGPEEYHRIEDFDLYDVEGQREVWVSDNMSLKIYDATDFSFKQKISYPFVIYKFKRLENSHILVITGRNENILTLTDKEGSVISEYLKKEIPYIMFRPVQFISHGSDYLFQLGISNSFVAFDPETETFRKCEFTKEPSYLTDTQLLDLFNNKGTDFIMDANQGSYINNILSFKDATWVQTVNAGEKYMSKVQDGQTISTKFTYGTVLATFSAGESDDSILMYITPDQLFGYEKEVKNKFGNKINCEIEDNPYILEFF